MADFDAQARFARSPVAHLATAGPDGRPHLVPVVFAVHEQTVYTAVDAKPKTTQRLRRLTNIEGNPRVSLLVDHYDDDWSQLWWARADGQAVVRDDDEALTEARAALGARYPQHVADPPEGPVIEVTVGRWSGWTAS